MEKNKNKINHVKKNFLTKIKNNLDRFLIILIVGLQLALLISYLYVAYKNKLIASEGIRDTLTYQGKVANAQGVPPPDGLYDMRFKIYDQAEAGSLLWTEIWNGTNQGSAGSKVNVNQGVFTVELNSLCASWSGTCASNGGVNFTTDSFYLQVELDYNADGTYEEIFLPRKRFTATPYAMNAEKVDGHDAADFVLKAGDTMTGDLESLNLKIDKNAYINYGGSGGWNLEYAADDLPVSATPSWTKNGTQTESVADGILHLTDSSDSDAIYYIRAESNISVTSPVIVEARVKVISSSGDNSPGINIYNGSKIGAVQFKTDKIEYLYDPSKYYNLDLTQYHLIRLVQLDSNLKVYVDGGGTAVIDTALTNDTSGKEIYFGHIGTTGTGESYWDYVRYSYNGEAGKLYFSGAEGNESAYLHYDSTNSVLEINKSLKSLGDLVTSGKLSFDNGVSNDAYIKWNSQTNQIEFGTPISTPNSLPYLNNAGSQQDYTHYTNSHKILAYDFSDSSGTTVTDLAGHANGTLTAGAWKQSGYIGYCLAFGLTNAYVDFANPGLSNDTGAVEMWVRLNSLSSATNYLLSMQQSSSNHVVLYKENTSDLYASVGDSGAIDTDWNFPDTNWHHIALDWYSGNLEVFVDGVSIKTGTYSTLDVDSFTTFRLGSDSSGINSLDGDIDSFAIYDSPFTVSDALSHYNSAYADIFVANNIGDGYVLTTLSDLNSLPETLNGKSDKTDPVYFNTSNRMLALSFSEGGGNQTQDQANGSQGAMYGTSWIKQGYHGFGMQFDGTNDYLDFSDNSSYNPGTDDFSVELFIKCNADTTQTDKRIISRRDGDTGLELFFNSNNAPTYFLGDGSNTVVGSFSGLNICNGDWIHVLMSFDRDGNATVYNNGYPINTTSISSVSGDISNSSDLFIGSDGTTNFYNGLLDSVVIYRGLLLNSYDAYARIFNGPESFILSSRSVANNSTNFASINLSNNGSAGIFANWGQNNPDNYPLRIVNDSNYAIGEDSGYHLISFGSDLSNTFGNLSWENNTGQFILDRGLWLDDESYVNIFEGRTRIGGSGSPSEALDVTGNIQSSGWITGELRAIGTAPSTSGDSCTAGDIRYASGFIYICIDTDTWKRAELTSW